MGSKLLVRCYNVGCGDCIYVRIPNGRNDDFHMLIDCGSKESAKTKIMRNAIKHLENELPPDDDDPGKKRLDMIVVTHRHEDHIKGFDSKFFNKIAIKHIWITGAMDKSHPQAEKANALHEFAAQGMKGLQGRSGLSPELQDLVALYSIGNPGATKALTETLPQKNGIEPTFVFAGDSSDDFGIEIAKTKLKVLAPEKDIDRFYLGKETDEKLLGLLGGTGTFSKQSRPLKNKIPSNIGTADFRKLQRRMLSNALAFAVDDSKIQNNVSTVILIEWGKRRLLFVGDAEWHDEFEEGKKNGSWNVMWNERRDELSKPLDFLKVGHHGSFNATPWNRDEDDDHEVNQIFNSILPLPKSGKKPTAKCIVSTKRKQYDTIPDAELLVELGKRVSNTVNYEKRFEKEDPDFNPEQEIFNYSKMKEYSTEPSPREVGEKGWFDKPQPERTDMESKGKGQEGMLKTVELVEVEIDP